MIQMQLFTRKSVDCRLKTLDKSLHSAREILALGPLVRTPGGGDSHMKGAGMLIVSLRGVNF